MISRWPSSKTKRAPQKVHPLPQPLQNSRVFSSRPKPLLRSVHPPVTQLRAIDLEPVLLRAARDAPRSKPVTEGDKPRFSIGARVLCAKSPGPYVALTLGREYTILSPCESHAELTEDERCDHVTVLCDDGETDGIPVELFEPAPVAAPQPAGARFVVGDHVKLIGHCMGDRRMAGQCGVVITVDDSDAVLVDGLRRLSGEACSQYVAIIDLEPLPSETPERGDWTPEACGWRLKSFPGREQYGGPGNEHAWLIDGEVNWRWNPNSTCSQQGTAPTLAQACCAALSIELRPCSCITPSCTNHAAYLGGEGTKLAFGDTAESCARLALAAHARLVSR